MLKVLSPAWSRNSDLITGRPGLKPRLQAQACSTGVEHLDDRRGSPKALHDLAWQLRRFGYFRLQFHGKVPRLVPHQFARWMRWIETLWAARQRFAAQFADQLL